MIPLPSHFDDFDPAFSTSWSKLSYSVETSPRVYLGFAITDFEEAEKEKSDRVLVNSLSNAKRALHLQVETIAKAFGFTWSKKSFPNFHEYLSYCQRCGLVTPRILKKLNKVRNAVEHSYYIPSEAETEDFIDVVELFLAATDKYIFQFPTFLEWLPGTVDESVQLDIHSIQLEANTGALLLVTSNKNHEGVLVLDPSMDEFYIWLHVLADGVHKGNF